MAHYRKRYPTKVKGNKCVMCQWEKMTGNSKANEKPSDGRAREQAKSDLGGLPNRHHR